MHLGIYVPIFDERPAGLGTYVLEVCKRLVRANRGGVTVFTETPQTLPDALGPHVRVYSLGLPHGLSAVPGLRAPWRFFDLSVKLPWACEHLGVDVLFCPTSLGALLPRTPQVVVIHDLTMLKHPSDFFSLGSKIFARCILPQVLRASHTVIGVSQHTCTDLLETFLDLSPERLVKVTEGYDRALYCPPPPERIAQIKRLYKLEGRPYLMYSGTFASHKNVTLLPLVLRTCLDRGLDLDLVFTGRTDAGAFEPIGRAIAQQDVHERIRHLGYVPKDHLAPLMAGACSFTFPSLYEGFGLAPLEAMASGALVLSSDRASLAEVVQGGGVLLDPLDAQGWAKAIEDFIDHPERAAKQRLAAIDQAAQFDWDEAVSQIQDILDQALA